MQEIFIVVCAFMSEQDIWAEYTFCIQCKLFTVRTVSDRMGIRSNNDVCAHPLGATDTSSTRKSQWCRFHLEDSVFSGKSAHAGHGSFLDDSTGTRNVFHE